MTEKICWVKHCFVIVCHATHIEHIYSECHHMQYLGWTGLTCWGVCGLYWTDSGFGGPALFGTVCVESETPRSEHPRGLLGLETHTDRKDDGWACLKHAKYPHTSGTQYRAPVCPAGWWGFEMAWGHAWGCFPLHRLVPCPARSPP